MGDMTRMIPFTKMHGLGNDFVVIDAREPSELDWSALARAMCDRHFGVGADQLLLVAPSANADITMRLFNVDGFEAEMCGNGVRCIGKYVYERDIVRKPELSVETLGGIKRLRLQIADGVVTGASVSMGVPRIEFDGQPVQVGRPARSLTLAAVNMGNPHAVALVDTPLAEFPMEAIGAEVERHALFPNRTNFEAVNVLSRRALRVRVWERSVGITLACGTGACASMVAARLRGAVEDEVAVHLPGGSLSIGWDGAGEVTMTGPASAVFEGQWLLLPPEN